VSHSFVAVTRKLFLVLSIKSLFALLIIATICNAARATALSPFIDLQEAGLTTSSAGAGLRNWDRTTPINLTIHKGGTIRFALLYWAGRERPCDFNGSTCTFSQPYKDQQMVFNGTALTGTVIGTESQPSTPNGPILNIGYFADVTSLVSAAGNGDQTFTFNDGNAASNLWRLEGVSLYVAYTNAADSTFYRVIIWDNLDFAHGDDPTPGETRVTSPVTFGHGANASSRTAQLTMIVGGADYCGLRDRIDISNNPSQNNTLMGSEGVAWDNNEYNITIPANVDNTVVQVVSPAGQLPDRLLWQMAALRVALPPAVGEFTSALLIPSPPSSSPNTIVGSSGAVDDSNLTQYEIRNQFATIKDSISSATVTYRYNLPAAGRFKNCASCVYGLRIRYRDTGVNQRVIVRLKAARLGVDGIETLYQFDSDGLDTNGTESPPNSSANQTHNACLVMPADHLKHGNYSYYLEVEIQKTANDGTPSPGFIAFVIAEGNLEGGLQCTACVGA
jgi:hypothetical protein